MGILIEPENEFEENMQEEVATEDIQVEKKETENVSEEVTEETVSEDNKAVDEAAPEDAEEVSAEAEENASDEEGKPKERKLNWTKRGGEKKESETDILKGQIAEANDKYARLFAEFDNFRKRSEKEKSARYDMGAKDVIEKILPVLDNFERGFDSVEESDKEDAFVTGMDLIYKQFQKVLEDLGVKPIEAVGQAFDPELHNAVMHVDDPEVGENIVVEEFQKGYTYKDQVVRYSMVKVAN